MRVCLLIIIQVTTSYFSLFYTTCETSNLVLVFEVLDNRCVVSWNNHGLYCRHGSRSSLVNYQTLKEYMMIPVIIVLLPPVTIMVTLIQPDTMSKIACSMMITILSRIDGTRWQNRWWWIIFTNPVYVIHLRPITSVIIDLSYRNTLSLDSTLALWLYLPISSFP